MLKKFGALVLALLMVLSVSTAALAEDNPAEFNEDGIAGKWEKKDTEIVQNESINIKKEIVAYNPNGTEVNAPVVTYTYTVTPATVAGLTVTDDGATNHESGEDAQAPIKAGITDGLVVTGTAAGTAGTETSAVGTLVFTNASIWTTAEGGATNEYNIKLDFTNVAFDKPGVYRYQIVETISAASYDVIAMEDGDFNTVYLDVYVDGNLDIYGYVCMKANGSVIPSTEKINGFVDASESEDDKNDGSDKYYTYDLVLSKDVVNDSYAEANIAFPFTVIFKNSENYTSTFTIGEIVEESKGSTGFKPTAASAPTWSGVAKVKEGGPITYTGIPAGVDVDVYETNIVTGVTYTVVTTVNGEDMDPDNNVSWTDTTPTSAVAQENKFAYESTKATVVTTKNTAVTTKQTLNITNKLLLISPTGVVLRIAPYVMILAAGIALLLISRRRKASGAEE